MPKLTENRLRTIIKEEIKAVLAEGEVIHLGPYLDQKREKEFIKNIGSDTQINDLAQALARADREGKSDIMKMIKSDAERFGIYDAVMAAYSKIISQSIREYDPSLELR